MAEAAARLVVVRVRSEDATPPPVLTPKPKRLFNADTNAFFYVRFASFVLL